QRGAPSFAACILSIPAKVLVPQRVGKSPDHPLHQTAMPPAMFAKMISDHDFHGAERCVSG
ncbi:MAG TPA: hypothetical protein VFF39_16585, partial [Verrucomicrobiae bacterium]|nr:hypothetical protein [Verrucomicrobiae bacterium]